MYFLLQKEEETERKSLRGGVTDELWHMDYPQLRIKDKTESEVGQPICKDDMMVWFQSLANFNSVWFLYTLE